MHRLKIILPLLLLLCLPSGAFAAISANTVWELRDDGSDSNSGGFVTGASGTDRSQQAAAHVVIDGATITATVHSATTQLNIVGFTVSAADVGNIFFAAGGTGSTGYYQITVADAVNNRWTVDRSAGTAAQTLTGRMGGAKASIGGLGAAVNSGNVANTHAYIRSGTYTLTSSSGNASGGTYSNTNNISCQIIGYNASLGRSAPPFDTSTGAFNGPTIDCGAIATITVFDLNNANASGVSIFGVKVDGKGNSSIVAFDLANNGTAVSQCWATNCTTGYTAPTANQKVMFCRADLCTTGFIGMAVMFGNWADGCTTGFVGSNNSPSGCFCCAATDCTTPYDTNSFSGHYWIYCTGEGGSGDAYNGPTLGATAISSLATNMTGNGFDVAGSMSFLLGNATYGNGTPINAAAAGQTVQLGNLTLSADPYVDAANDDYRPNNKAGGGNSIRAAGQDVLGQVDNSDIGAVQHSEASAAGIYSAGGAVRGR